MAREAHAVTRGDVWLRMLLYPRHTLPTALAPVLVAGALAWHAGVFAPLPALAALLAGWLVQLGGVFTDNYTNLVRHPDDREHALFVQALRRGVISLGTLRLAIVGVYAGAVLVGLYLVAIGGRPALLIGLASIAASLAYSVGPFPLGDRALGDPLFFVFFGLVSVLGTYYVQAAAVLGGSAVLGAGAGWWPAAGTLPPVAWVAGLPVAALTTNILIIDNIRDRAFDHAKRETTVAVLIGRRWSLAEYGALLALAYAVPLGLFAWGGWPGWVCLPWLSLPYALWVYRRLLRTDGHDALVPLTPQAGQVLLAHTALFAAGLAL
jgi:1,4-dihydroxy-2-naphthoate octaprenyltransferase